MKYDIIIIGGGIVGCALASALAQRSALSIALMEANTPTNKWNLANYSNRVSAITLTSKRILTNLQVWDEMVSRRVSPFSEISVWDTTNKGQVEFKSNEIGEATLGFIVENSLLQEMLLNRVKQLPNIDFISPIQLNHLENGSDNISLHTEDESYQAKLVIGADGANSWVRTQANIQVDKKAYDQSAIVCTVTTSLPHQKIARQCFLETGPIAFLPLLPPNLCSIVWSVPTEEANILVNLADDKFLHELNSVFGILGSMTHCEQRAIFPLYKQQAKNYIAPRVALVGDAAHAVHPLAGQGVNMGLLDMASLVDVITQASNLKRDFSSRSTLRRYERWRKADNLALFLGIDALKILFAHPNTVLQKAVSVGMNVTNRLSFLKNFFTRYACGERKNLPNLAR